ncbi:glycosyltransferase family 2 protein [Salinicola tamaricis]|uniref:glycosyltransferase family 2 protein n=1 Tax=Salinicola tamaricis TaxID=1771309 RepID=UPI0013EC306A|nr:glycosyltransferase family 2 protein [Salinicola tamaricis]
MMARRDPALSYRLAMVAIVKNEHDYLPEWVAYHRMIGVEHFYIADNGSDDGTDLLLASWQRLGLVTTCSWTPEDKAQTSWYAHVLETWGREAEFMAFLDADEFLVLPTATGRWSGWLRYWRRRMWARWRSTGASSAPRTCSGASPAACWSGSPGPASRRMPSTATSSRSSGRSGSRR